MMIQVDRLTKYFGPVRALDNASFGIEANEIVGLLGNNGAGKTTLMRILTTYLPATSGIARVAGFDVLTQSMEVRQRIGYLPESIPLYPEMRVEEYLQFRGQLKGLDRLQRKKRVAGAWTVAGLRKFAASFWEPFPKGIANGWVWPMPCLPIRPF